MHFPDSFLGTGRTNAIAVDPNNANIWYVGAPAGGIWKSTDAGSSWTNLFDDFPQIGVSGIAIDPNDSNIIYIATGDDDAADSYSVGVFKSIDGGASWQETGLIHSTSNVNTLMNEIIIDPVNSVYYGWQPIPDCTKVLMPVIPGIIRQFGYIADLKLKPGDPNTVYAISSSCVGGSVPGYLISQPDGLEFTALDSPVLPTTSGRAF